MLNNEQQAKTLAAGFERGEGRARHVEELKKRIAKFDVRWVAEGIPNLPQLDGVLHSWLKFSQPFCEATNDRGSLDLEEADCTVHLESRLPVTWR